LLLWKTSPEGGADEEFMKMNRTMRYICCLLPLVLLTAGCYSNVSLVFRNGTQNIVHVQGEYDGGPVEVAPGKAKPIPGAGHGDLYVTTDTGRQLIFTDIETLGVDPKYRKEGSYTFFGIPNYDIFNVMFATNNSLYALVPGKNAVDPTVPQPADYPKTGKGKGINP